MSTLYPDAFKDGSTAAHRMDPVADLLGGGRTIAYQLALARLAGSATTGVWLSQLWFWTNFWQNSGRTDSNRWDGDWLAWTQEEVEEQTALSRREHDTARKTLREMGVIEESKRGLPMKIWFRLDKDRLYTLLRAYADRLSIEGTNNLGGKRQDGETDNDFSANLGGSDQSILAENANLKSTNAPAHLGGNRQDIEVEEIIDRSVDRSTTDQAAAPVAVQGINAVGTDQTNAELVERIAAITGCLGSAQSIIDAFGTDVVARQLGLWHTRSKIQSNPGGLFRSACQQDWPDPSVAKAAARAESDRRRTPRYVSAPRESVSGGDQAARRVVAAPLVVSKSAVADQITDTERARLDAIAATLSPCALDRLDAEVDRRIGNEKPWLAGRLATYRAGERVSGPTVPDTIAATRYTILTEREAAPIMVATRAYYDNDDAHAARLDAGFG